MTLLDYFWAWGETKSWWDEVTQLMAERRQRQKVNRERKGLGWYIYPPCLNGMSSRTISLLLGPSFYIPNTSQLPIKLWTHQWINVSRISEPWWSNHFTKALPLKIAALRTKYSFRKHFWFKLWCIVNVKYLNFTKSILDSLSPLSIYMNENNVCSRLCFYADL